MLRVRRLPFPRLITLSAAFQALPTLFEIDEAELEDAGAYLLQQQATKPEKHAAFLQARKVMCCPSLTHTGRVLDEF